MINGLIAPHGGELILNMASEQEQDELRERAKGLPQVEIGSRQLADLEMLAIGAYSPLGGFMTRADYPRRQHRAGERVERRFAGRARGSGGIAGGYDHRREVWL